MPGGVERATSSSRGEVAPFDVVALGALNVDLIAEGPSVTEDSEHRRPRHEIFEIFEQRQLEPVPFLGGSAFTAIRMLGQLKTELRLAMIGVAGSVAADGLRTDHVAALSQEHISFLGSPAPAELAGTCGSVSSPGGAWELWTDPGANIHISGVLTQAVQDRIADCRVLHLTSLLEPLGSDGDAIAGAVADFLEEFRARNELAIVSVDPGEPWSRATESDAVRRIFAVADVLLVNRQEFKLLTGASPDSRSAVRYLRDLCPRAVVHLLKDVEGVVLEHPTGMVLAALDRPTDAPSVDSTGAGDGVAAGVLAALGSGRSLVEEAALGLRLAQQRASRLGDQGHRKLHLSVPDPWTPRLTGPEARGWDLLVKRATEAEPVVRVAAAVVALLIAVLGIAVGKIGLP